MTLVGEGNEAFFIRVWKSLPSRRVFKTVRLVVICNGPKWTIFASGGHGLLQMILESDTERCVSEDAGSSRGWIVRSYIGWRGEQSIPYKGVEISP